jgi:hypothetical protein
VSGAVSLAGGAISYRSAGTTVRRQLQQTQFGSVISKRIELYPRLWRIHIFYETNWALEGKRKDRAWAQAYVEELNEFNLIAGVFFSQALYEAFFALRAALYDAIKMTAEGQAVPPDQVKKIRAIVYTGIGDMPSLSTVEKDDLGSYRPVELQRRLNR